MPYDHSHREATFYENLISSERKGEFVWPSFIPRYYGKKVLKIGDDEEPFIELDDFTLNLRHPNVLDVKLGGVNKPGDGKERVGVRASKYPFYEELGFRLDGCQVYNRDTGEYTWLSPKTNRTMDELKKAVRSFLTVDDPTTDSMAIVRSIAPKIEEVEQWVLQQKQWKFYSVSALIAYEPNASSSSSNPVPCRVAFVDFVHVSPFDGVDQMCVKGLRRLKPFLQENAVLKRRSGSG